RNRHRNHTRNGFRDKPLRVRFRILDLALALLPNDTEHDHTLTEADFARFDLPVETVFITENEINFLAFPPCPASDGHLRRRLRLPEPRPHRLAQNPQTLLLGRHRHPRFRYPQPVPRAVPPRHLAPHGSRNAPRPL
ncbi:hypothetical protein EST62_09950, partial [Chlorobaculum sp. 24CR]